MDNIKSEINVHGLEFTIEEALQTHTSVVGGSYPQVTGIYVVGSCLTDEFEPHVSDIDLYIETDTEYEHEDGFLSVLNDPDDHWNTYLQENITIPTSKVDVIGLVQSSKRIRDPHIYFSL